METKRKRNGNEKEKAETPGLEKGSWKGWNGSKESPWEPLVGESLWVLCLAKGKNLKKEKTGGEKKKKISTLPEAAG